MNRLTNSTNSIIKAIATPIDVHKKQLIYLKLKSLEDIEEELEIDLITLFKALKQKYIFHKENVKIELVGLHIKSNELYLYGFVEDTAHAVYLSLKEYGKTWSVCKEDLTNE